MAKAKVFDSLAPISQFQFSENLFCIRGHSRGFLAKDMLGTGLIKGMGEAARKFFACVDVVPAS